MIKRKYDKEANQIQPQYVHVRTHIALNVPFFSIFICALIQIPNAES